MARWNRGRKLFDHTHTEFWRHRLIDVEEPNLQREIFPYDRVPLIDFDHRHLYPDPAEDIFITDTTFRDGQQARPPLKPEQIAQLFELLHRLGGKSGLIRQSEFFLYSDRDRAAVELCLEKGYKHPEVTGWIRANEDDLELVSSMGLRETGILTSVSDYHIFFKFNSTRSKAMEGYLRVVKKALEMELVPRCHFEDVTRADIYGFCVPFAIELMKLREESGTDIKIRLCDTLGYGITYPGAALPRSVPKLVRTMIDDAGVPGSLLEWHGHNDFHKVLINASTAWLYGCAAANGTLLGFGERTGNPPLEGLVIEYLSLTGREKGIETTVITEIARYFEKELGIEIASNYPFVGANFNATAAGIHADGLIKNEEIYNIFDTRKILNRPIPITINDKSGIAGIAYWLNVYLGLEGDLRVDKRHPGIVRMAQIIKEEYEERGRTTSMSNEEMHKLASGHLPEYFVSPFDKLKEKAIDLAEEMVEELAETEKVRTMDTSVQEAVLERALKEHPFIQYIYITDSKGLRTTRNIVHIADKAKFETASVGEDLSDREWFTLPLRTGKVHVTGFYISKYTEMLCITVSAPIRDEEDAIVGILGVDIKFEYLAKL